MSNENGLDQIKLGHSQVPVETLLLQRWSPRAFADTPISDEALKQIFTAASWAASSYNEQPWRFLVGRKGDEVWNKIFDALAPFVQAWAKDAPVLYTGFAKKTFSHNQLPNTVAMHDLGAASANAALQATAMGLYVHGIGAFDKPKLTETCAVPEDFEAVACWTLGHFGDPETLADNWKTAERQPRVRKVLADFVFKAWGEPAL